MLVVLFIHSYNEPHTGTVVFPLPLGLSLVTVVVGLCSMLRFFDRASGSSSSSSSARFRFLCASGSSSGLSESSESFESFESSESSESSVRFRFRLTCGSRATYQD